MLIWKANILRVITDNTARIAVKRKTFKGNVKDVGTIQLLPREIVNFGSNICDAAIDFTCNSVQ